MRYFIILAWYWLSVLSTPTVYFLRFTKNKLLCDPPENSSSGEGRTDPSVGCKKFYRALNTPRIKYFVSEILSRGSWKSFLKVFDVMHSMYPIHLNGQYNFNRPLIAPCGFLLFRSPGWPFTRINELEANSSTFHSKCIAIQLKRKIAFARELQ